MDGAVVRAAEHPNNLLAACCPPGEEIAEY